MRRSRKSRPTLRIDSSARSLYLDAHTPCINSSQHLRRKHAGFHGLLYKVTALASQIARSADDAVCCRDGVKTK